MTITGRNEQRLEETKQALLNAQVPLDHINVVVGDVTTSEGQDSLIKSTLEKFGKIDILVNNAGAGIPDAEGKTGVNQSIETYHKTFELNVQSVIEMTQKVRQQLAKTQGEIVNVSSIGAGPSAVYALLYHSLSPQLFSKSVLHTIQLLKLLWISTQELLPSTWFQRGSV